MYRVAFYTFLGFIGLNGLWSFRPLDVSFEQNPSIYNSILAQLVRPEPAPEIDYRSTVSIVPDTFTHRRVFMFDYSSYGSPYNGKVKAIIERYLPNTTFAEFSNSEPESLISQLSNCDVAVVAYPSTAAKGVLQAVNKALKQFVQSGGTVILTGTHEFEILQQMGLFDLDFGYYSKERPIHINKSAHPICQGVHNDFALSNFSYPLDVSDSAFVTLADVDGYPVIGYKNVGLGKAIYIGVEYYFDESESSQILLNAISRDLEVENDHIVEVDPLFQSSSPRKNEELLFAGTGPKMEEVDLKIYPNPYYSKATLDINVAKPTPVMVEMTDKLGRIVALVFPKKTIGPGLCRFELPNINPGIYFLQVQMGGQTYVRKVVKSSTN